MRRFFSDAWGTACLALALCLAGCGGGGGSSPPAATSVGAASVDNVQPVTVNAGPTGQIPNSVLTAVTICVPGTSTCQTIPNVLVDTGSSGLRLLASLVTIPLPSVSGSGGTYSECAQFADGVVWGAVATADVQLAGEKAGAVSVQVVRDNGVGPAAPANCAARGTVEDNLASLGANGILGVGLFLQDCGTYCVTHTDELYSVCTGQGVCTGASLPLAQQVANPAASFLQDNNGVLLQLAAIGDTGAVAGTGSLIFGIGTQANNVQTGKVLTVPGTGTTAGYFTASYQGVTLPNSFFDSGSTGLFFDDPNLPSCTATGVAGGFYCPGSRGALSATPLSVAITGSNGVSITVSGLVANAEFLLSQAGGSDNAFDDLAGPTGATLPSAFDFGVPFFFGKSVFTAFEQRTTPNGTGPYFAFQTP